MTVNALIKQLKKFPPGLEVYTQDHDAHDYELSSHVKYVLLWNKEDLRGEVPEYDQREFDDNPEECVVIRC